MATGAVGFALMSCAQGSNTFEVGGVGGTATGGSGGLGQGGRTGASTGSSSSSGGAGGAGGAPATTTSSGFPNASSSGAGGAPATTTSSGFPAASSSVATTAAASSSSGGPSSSCDLGDCTSCQECSQCLPTCADLENLCLCDCGCANIFFCVELECNGNVACEDACLADEPGPSADLFEQWASCVVCACQETCAVPSSECP